MVIRRYKKKVRGHVFIEVLFGIFMVAFAAAILAATMPIANTSRAKADIGNKAVSLAQKQLEAIRGAGYPNATPAQLATLGFIDSITPVSTNTYSFSNSDSAALDNPSRILPSGSGTVRVEQADLDLRSITVTVQWQDRGRTRSFSVGTLVANL